MTTEEQNTTSHRLPNGWYELRRGGRAVGQAWRMQTRSDGTRQGGWGVKLNGVYWRKGEANTRGGSTTTSASTLTAARQLADLVLDDLVLS